MSLVTDSPVHSSSSGDDFAAFLDEELGSGSSDSSDEEEVESFNESAEEDDDDQHESKRLKVQDVEEVQGSSSQLLVEKEIVSVKQESCEHPGTYENMCMVCGKVLDGESGVPVGYINKGLRLRNDEMVRLRTTDFKKVLRRKKLYLILDLDHTLLNSTHLMHLTPEEDYLNGQIDSPQDIPKGSLFRLDSMRMMTKLRPFVRAFLKEASEMFEMYIYTMGDRPYALEMAKLLDPKGEYFHDKVISRDDGSQRHQKGLDVVLGEESAVLILDDTEIAWTKHKDNLILMERYHFFASSCHQFGYKCQSLSQLKSDESETEGALSSVLRVLRQIHSIFFNELDGKLENRDVRQMLKTVRKEVLKGCKIVFSHVIPIEVQPDTHYLWRMAEQLGAECLAETDPSVTHVVSNYAGTEKSRWAVIEKKFLVNPRRLEATNFFWQKQAEENYPSPVSDPKKR